MIKSYTILQQTVKNKEKLQKILNDFYLLTHIKICVCDADGNEIAYAPEKHCAFCKYVNSSKKGTLACTDNARYIKQARLYRKPVLYNCHMGLIECISPIFNGNNISGYVMIGQLTDNENGKELSRNALEKIEEYGLSKEKALELYGGVKYASHQTINASLSILEACASYLYLNDLLSGSVPLATEIDKYCFDNASSKLTVDALCSEFNMARSELYGFYKTNYGENPADRVKSIRLEKACSLLTDTALSITEITEKIGISNYNYFSKIFKQKYGVTPTEYRKNNK
ncbi:MAG: PocR ligand-binding domain-containing protein [Clostridia bacterium]|nr:PocR ligand-binding domain-containing protein [Clostridia bacterium]